MKKLAYLYITLTLIIVNVNAQVINTGTEFFLSQDAVVSIDDKYEHQAGTILNYGKLFIKSDWINMSNNQVFDKNSIGFVIFNGNQISLKGSQITLFPNLIFKGNSSYILNTNIEVNHSLNLEDAELMVKDGNVLKLLNGHVNSLIRNNGVIFTETNRALFVRQMNEQSSYLFPMASANQLKRFVTIEPEKNGDNTYSVSLVADNPSTNGYSSLNYKKPIEQVNTGYYHLISRTNGFDKANILFYTNNSTEKFNALAQWSNLNQWEYVNPSSFADNSIFSPLFNSLVSYNSANLALGISVPFAFANVVNTQSLEFYNAFSPDGDGKNDTWEIPNIDNYPDNDLKIYDRSGNIIYNVAGYNSTKYWSAEKVNSGTYIYILRVKSNGVNKYYKGTVTVIKN